MGAQWRRFSEKVRILSACSRPGGSLLARGSLASWEQISTLFVVDVSRFHAHSVPMGASYADTWFMLAHVAGAMSWSPFNALGSGFSFSPRHRFFSRFQPPPLGPSAPLPLCPSAPPPDYLTHPSHASATLLNHRLARNGGWETRTSRRHPTRGTRYALNVFSAQAPSPPISRTLVRSFDPSILRSFDPSILRSLKCRMTGHNIR